VCWEGRLRRGPGKSVCSSCGEVLGSPRSRALGWLGHHGTALTSSRATMEAGWSSYVKIHVLPLVNSSHSCFGGHGECFLCHQASKDTKILLQIIDSFLAGGWPRCRLLYGLFTARLQKYLPSPRIVLIALCTVIRVADCAVGGAMTELTSRVARAAFF